jgi:hypothetical protein
MPQPSKKLLDLIAFILPETAYHRFLIAETNFVLRRLSFPASSLCGISRIILLLDRATECAAQCLSGRQW